MKETIEAQFDKKTYKQPETKSTENNTIKDNFDGTISKTVDETVETVLIANQEIPIDSESVTLMISDIENATDIRGLENLYNLKSLDIIGYTDGNTPNVSGFDSLKGCETLESLSLSVGFEDSNDIYILNTLPNLKSLTIYGIEAYEDWDFNLEKIKHLKVVGTFDVSRIIHLTSLESLYMEYNDSKELSPITKLSDLCNLAITECGFTDYTALLKFNNLNELFISSIPMTEEMYNQIAEKLPECKITIVNNFFII